MSLNETSYVCTDIHFIVQTHFLVYVELPTGKKEIIFLSLAEDPLYIFTSKNNSTLTENSEL